MTTISTHTHTSTTSIIFFLKFVIANIQFSIHGCNARTEETNSSPCGGGGGGGVVRSATL